MKEKGTITEVEDSEKYHYIRTGSSGFGLDKKYGVVPKVGDTVEVELVRGSTVRGVKLNGVEVFYKTESQLEEEHKQVVAEINRKRREEFEKNKAKLDKDFDSLPKPFQDRIARFRENNPEFRIDYEGYEMFCCKEAIKMAEALKTPEEVDRFSKLDCDEQRKLVDFDEGHSGNTFGSAVRLAYWYLKESNAVSQLHASLSPLVGSSESGDLDAQEAHIIEKAW